MDEQSSNILHVFSQATIARDSSTRENVGHRLQSNMQIIQERGLAFDRILKNVERFQQIVNSRPDRDKMLAMMEAEVTRARHDIASAAEDELSGSREDVPDSVVGEYRLLALRGRVDPGLIFPEIPEPPSICSFQKLAEASKYGAVQMSGVEQQRFNQQWAASFRLFVTRWERLTGRPFDTANVPNVRDVLRHRAPTPMMPAWTPALSAREALALRAEPVQVAGGGQTHPMVSVDPATNAQADDCTCSAESVFDRAGLPPLKAPAAGEPRYTFPGQLLQREDIFYDYGLVIPVAECGPLADKAVDYEGRALTGTRAAAGEALSVLDFLRDMNLSSALGHIPDPGAGQSVLLVDELRATIEDMLLTLDENTPLHEVQRWKRTMAEWANILRDASRRTLFRARLGGQDPRNFLNSLSAAVSAPLWGNIGLYREDRISYNQVPEGTDQTNYLRLEQRTIGNVRDIHGNMCIDENDQVRNLRPYLEFLAGDFYTQLRELIDTATDMRDAVASFQGNSVQLQSDFERLASGIVNEALMVMAQLLDDVASLMPLWSQERSEGSMRLGLLVVFRQYWSPEGYVKGKLVGYKNLMPDQSEKLRRRTFIKSVREEATTTEFAQTRQQDFSSSRKETSELISESMNKFNLSSSVSGGFDILIANLDVNVETEYGYSDMSRSTQSAIAESTMKSAMSFNEKREVKLREETEVSEEFESVTELKNPNSEITANYFYYQLLRQYVVTMQMHDVRPVLLRTRHVPSESAIDQKFLADNAHLLINALPAQLSVDLRETANEIEGLGRMLSLARVRYMDDQRAYQDSLSAPRPADPEQARERENRISNLQEVVRQSYAAYINAEQTWAKMRTRLDRVVNHVRANRTHFMQYLWQGSPSTDYDRILRSESFGGIPLPELTRGLRRQGYLGEEEIFDFSGPSWALTDALLRVLTPGSDLSALSDEELRRTSLFQQLAAYYSEQEIDNLILQIRNQTFLTDPADRDALLSSRRVQVAQDALVVETIPGQVPLLEGFKMAHRMLDVERACLENSHLRERIEDRIWQNSSEDVYRVNRDNDSDTAVPQSN